MTVSGQCVTQKGQRCLSIFRVSLSCFKESFCVKTNLNLLSEITKTLSCFLWITAPKDLQTPKKLMTPGKENACSQKLKKSKSKKYSEVLSDSEDCVFVESSWQDYRNWGVKDLKESQRCMKLPPPQNQKESVATGSPDFLVGRKERSCEKSTENKTPTVPLRPSTGLESDSSDSEFESLIERVRKRSVPRKPLISTSKSVYQPSPTGKK